MEHKSKLLQMSLAMAMRLVKAKGYALHRGSGLEAAIRRAISRLMQMPKSSSSTSKHVVMAFLDNVPREWQRGWLVMLGWPFNKSSSSKEKMQLEAHKPKAVSQMASLHRLLRGKKLVYIASKLYKPAKEPRARAVLTLILPGIVKHRRRVDGSECVGMSFNLAIMNKVHAAPTHVCVPSSSN
eukprot:2026490-Pleurochrysis_carterae.AAC.5